MRTFLRIPCLLGVALALACTGRDAAAEIYRWKDSSGREHYTTDRGHVPPEHRASAKPAGSGTVSTYASPSAPAPPSTTPASNGSNGAPRLGATGAAAPAPTAEIRGGHDEAWWRHELESHTRRIEDFERQVAACPEIPSLPAPSASGGYDRRAYDRAAEQADRCTQARGGLGIARTQLERFQENARRLDVPPGWVR